MSNALLFTTFCLFNSMARGAGLILAQGMWEGFTMTYLDKTQGKISHSTVYRVRRSRLEHIAYVGVC